MILEWLYGWYASLRSERPPNAWEHDPYILNERERQHERGVVDAALVTSLQAEVARRRRERKDHESNQHA